jgi:hypothetical protein
MPGPSAVSDWTNDGKYLIVVTQGTGGTGDIIAVALEGGAKPSPVVATEASEVLGRLSPDNRWIAYASNRSGRNEVYVRPFDPPGTKAPRTGPVIQISRDTASAPKWRRRQRTVFPQRWRIDIGRHRNRQRYFPTGRTGSPWDSNDLIDVGRGPERTILDGRVPRPRPADPNHRGNELGSVAEALA